MISPNWKRLDQETLDRRTDEVFKSIGGFSYFQLFISTCYVLYNKSVMLVILSLSYLEKVPTEYVCTYEGQPGEEIACDPAKFCKDPTVLSYKADIEHKNYYENWVSKFDLTCASNTKMAFIASSYFIGWIITLLFLPRLSDLYGRHKIIANGNVIQVLAYTYLLYAPSYAGLIASMMVLGMMATIRTQVSVVYFYESMTKQNYTLMYATMAMLEGFIGLTAALYFQYMSKNWFWLIFFGYVAQVFGTIGSFFFPESPRYLIKTG